jgi:hypothetical protein
MLGDRYAYGRTREPAATMRMDDSPRVAFVCSGCGCSATTGDQRLLSAIGWKLLPAGTDDADLPAICPPCGRKPMRRP